MKFDSKTIPIIIIVLVAAAGAYWYFFTGTGNEPPLTATSPQGGAQTRFKTLVSRLEPITFNTGIFSDARFASLVDLTTPLSIEQSGRPDPFAVITGVGGE